MEQKIKLTQTYYDGISRGYQNLYHQEQIEKINLVKNHFPTQGCSLDLGSGDGVLNDFISSQVQLFSLDLSLELLKLNSNLNKIQASAIEIPFKKNSFDFIFAFTIIQDIPIDKIQIVIEEIGRILKINGTLIISFLKVSLKKEIIENQLKSNFKIIEVLEESKDLIYVLKKKSSKKGVYS